MPFDNTTKNHLVSVILPTYNRSNTIQRSINSVLKQTYSNIEVIVVDDASCDNTETIVRSINDHRITYIKHDQQKGGSIARNTGIGTARGEFIAFQDSDDEWMPSKLEKQMALMLSGNPDRDIIYSGFIKFSHKNKKMSYQPETWVNTRSTDVSRQLSYGNFIGTVTLLCSKNLILESGGFHPNLPKFQDWELAIRLSKKYSFVFIDEPLVLAFESDDSITRDRDAHIKALSCLIENHLDFFRLTPDHLAKQLRSIAHMLFLTGNRKRGLKYITCSIRYAPMNIISWLTLLCSISSLSLYKLIHKYFSY